MATNRTFTMIKPDAVVEANNIGSILAMITEVGFKVVAEIHQIIWGLRLVNSIEVHSARPFYGELVEFMSRGRIVAAILEKDNAVEEFRKLISCNQSCRRQKRVLSVNVSNPLVKTRYTVLILMKTLKSKAISSSVSWKILRKSFSRKRNLTNKQKGAQKWYLFCYSKIMLHFEYKRVSLQPHRGMEQLVARRAHNPKVIGSSPVPLLEKGFNWKPFLWCSIASFNIEHSALADQW